MLETAIYAWLATLFGIAVWEGCKTDRYFRDRYGDDND